MSSHSFISCDLHSDPGPIDEAPFANVPKSDTRFFGPMCLGTPSSSLGCPPVALQGGSNYGCAPGHQEACWDKSPDMTCFFGVPPGAPAIWTTVPGATPLHNSASK